MSSHEWLLRKRTGCCELDAQQKGSASARFYFICLGEAHRSLIQRSLERPALFSVFLAVGPGPQFLWQNKLLYMKEWIQPYRGLLFLYTWVEFSPQCASHGDYLIDSHYPITASCSRSSHGGAYCTSLVKTPLWCMLLKDGTLYNSVWVNICFPYFYVYWNLIPIF